MTRARDHLALATTGGALPWLDELKDGGGAPLIAGAGAALTVAGVSFAARPCPAPIEPVEGAGEATIEYGRPTSERTAHPPLRLRPSNAVLQGADVVVAATDSLGARIVLVGDPDLQLLGEAIHRFLAADDPAADVATRTARAGATLMRWGVPQVSPTDLITIADRLHAFVEKRFAGAHVLREWPVHAEEGLQVVSGRIDLLIDIGDGYAIIDHKSFPGSVAIDEARLRAFAAQVSLYASAIKRITGRGRFEYWVHQPVAAVMTQIEIR